MKIQKPVLSQLRRYRAVSFKPPELIEREGHEDTFKVRFVEPNGTEQFIPCTAEVFNYANGRRRAKSPHTGLDWAAQTNFIVLRDPGDDRTALVKAIHKYPSKTFAHNIFPEDSKEITTIIAEVNSTNGQVSVSQKPYALKEVKVVELLKAIDEVSELEVGQMIAGMKLSNIAGNKVTFEPDGDDED